MPEAAGSYIFYMQFVKGPRDETRREGEREERVERREKMPKSEKECEKMDTRRRTSVEWLIRFYFP